MSQNSQKLNRSQKRIFQKLERIVSGVSENQATVVKTTEPKEEQEEPKRVLKTIITENVGGLACRSRGLRWVRMERFHV
ncbi:hypothetical protein CK203_080399 [Vitis vinifera]|uniref:Uncharacterized protein n=1 Tax=Vitis vinifera TaxID=29760 RepID=A0A438F226_VITVI|nr:hypothetical protein CK203_080399 [Vitis vinifera]